MKVLIIGLGSIAKKHIEALREIESKTKIYALRSSTESQSFKQVIDIFSYEKISEIGFDFVIISNPTVFHYETIERLIEFEIPLFIEKPVFNNIGNIDKLLLKIKERNILTYVACNLRFLDSLIFIKNYFKKHQTLVNEVNIYCGSYLPDWRPNTDFRKVYSTIPELGGGVHLDLIHELDYVYWLFGNPKSTFSKLSSKSTLNIPAIDNAIYLLDYEQFIVNISLNYYRKDYKRTAEFVCEEETIMINLAENKVKNHEGKTLFEGNIGLRDTYIPQLKYFINLLKTNQKQSFNSIESGVEVLKICLNE